MLNDVQKLYDSMKDIKYGWKDKKNNFHFRITDGYVRKYIMQTNEELEKSRIGMCWETTELSRMYLTKLGLNPKTYFFVITNIKMFCHSIIVFEINNKYYWLENSILSHRGINEFNSLEELMFYIIKNFKTIIKHRNFNIKQLKIYEYEKPFDKANCIEYYFHCFRSKNITNQFLDKYLKTIVAVKN